MMRGGWVYRTPKCGPSHRRGVFPGSETELAAGDLVVISSRGTRF